MSDESARSRLGTSGSNASSSIDGASSTITATGSVSLNRLGRQQRRYTLVLREQKRHPFGIGLEALAAAGVMVKGA